MDAFLPVAGGMSYGAPVIASFQAPGDATDLAAEVVASADTAGNQDILINGRNFGRWSDRLVVEYFKEIEDSLVDDGLDFTKAPLAMGATSTLRFVPTIGSCRVTIDDRQLSCTMGPGAGSALDWVVRVDGQNSSNPVTSYAIPVISSVHPRGDLSSPVPMQGVSTDGGVRLSIAGRYFGPSGSSFNGDAGLVQRVAFSPGGAATRTGSYEAVRYAVMSHDRIDVVLPPAVGEGICFGLTVADQDAVSDQATTASDRCFDFALPSIDSASPITAPTDPSGEVMVLSGSNFGLLDPLADLTVMIGEPEWEQGVYEVAPARRIPSINAV